MKFERLDFYVRDFLEDERVRMLTWQERGGYTAVLFGMWCWAEKHGTVDLPDEDWVIAGAADIPYEDWVELRARLIDHPFAPLRKDEDAHIIYSPRLRKEYNLALARHEQATANGRRGGRPKGGKATDNPSVSTRLPTHNLVVSNGLAQPSQITNQGSQTTDQQPNEGDGEYPTPAEMSDVDVEKVLEAEVYVLERLGRTTLSSQDRGYLVLAISMVENDITQFRKLVDQAFQAFRPSHPRDRIHSFRYCLPVFEAWFARKDINIPKEPISYVEATRARHSRWRAHNGTLDHLVQPAE